MALSAEIRTYVSNLGKEEVRGGLFDPMTRFVQLIKNMERSYSVRKGFPISFKNFRGPIFDCDRGHRMSVEAHLIGDGCNKPLSHVNGPYIKREAYQSGGQGRCFIDRLAGVTHNYLHDGTIIKVYGQCPNCPRRLAALDQALPNPDGVTICSG